MAEVEKEKSKTSSTEISLPDHHGHSHGGKHGHSHSHHSQHEKSLRNTFGWTRIDVLTQLIVCIFLASFIFSLLIQALQNLIHMDQQDTMHHPIPVLYSAIVGLFLNGLCCVLIGGYTYHQGSFLHLNASGDVVLDRVVVGSSSNEGSRSSSVDVKQLREKDDQAIVKAGISTENKIKNSRMRWHAVCRDLCSKYAHNKMVMKKYMRTHKSETGNCI